MGNAAELTHALTRAKDELTISSHSFSTAVETLTTLTKHIEGRLKELEDKEATWAIWEAEMNARMIDIEEKEMRLEELERVIDQRTGELEEKEKRWKDAETRMAANAAKCEDRVTLNVGKYHTLILLIHILFNIFSSTII